MDANPLDFMSATLVLSSEVDSEIARFLKDTNLIAAPSFTKNAIEVLETRGVTYVTINTPLKDYKNYISNDVREAYTILNKLKGKKDLYALFENDLPDAYTEK